MEDATKKKSSFGAAGLIAGATMLSRVLGLVREQVFAYYFGAGFFTDAFQIAFRIPNLLRDLFAEGAMSSALVPVYTKARAEKGEARGWELANNALNVMGVISILIAVVGIFFADQLVSIYAPSFAQISGKHQLTVLLTQIMFPFLPFVAFAAVFMAILNSRDQYGISAFAPSFFNVASIIAAFTLCPLLASVWGVYPIYGMAVGAMVGGLLQWLVQWPALRRQGWTYRWVFKLKDPELLKMVALMGAGTFGLAATQINILVNSILASGLGEGAVSWLNYASRLMQFPIGVFGVAISIVSLTRVSKEIVDKDMAAVNETIFKGLSLVFYLTLPSAVGLAVLGSPIISVIYEYGKFTYLDTHATAGALAAYAVGLSAYSGVKVLGPIFYSFDRPKISVASSALAVCVNIVVGLSFSSFWGFTALALGTSMGALVNFLFLLWQLGRVSPGFPWRRMARVFGVSAVSAAIMGGLLLVISHYVQGEVFAPVSSESIWGRAGFILRVGIVGISLILGLTAYVLCANLGGLKELDGVLGAIKRKLR